MNEEKIWWAFTFGHGQKHFNKYVKIYGTYNEARNAMVLRFNNTWSMQYKYESKLFNDAVNNWGWQELK